MSLLSWVLRRINSLRSGVWAHWRSYSRRFSCLASSSARVGSTRGFGVLGWGVAFRDVFTAGLFQLWGRPPLLAGFGREKVNSKVWPIAHSCGAVRHLRECGGCGEETSQPEHADGPAGATAPVFIPHPRRSDDSFL